MTETPRRGDRYVFPLPANPGPWLVEITRVAGDNSWCDVRVWWLGMTWPMRLPMPLPASGTRVDWPDSAVQPAKPVQLELTRGDLDARLAEVRQEVAHEGDWYVPGWSELSEQERHTSTVEAGRWLEAFRRIGLVVWADDSADELPTDADNSAGEFDGPDDTTVESR